MRLPELCIRRPVMTTLLMGSVLLTDMFGCHTVSSAEAVATTRFIVTCPGTSADTMAAIAAPLERRFATIAGVTSITSLTTFGKSTITVEFDRKRTLDAAGPELQTAISAASESWPQDLPTPPTVVTGGDH